MRTPVFYALNESVDDSALVSTEEIFSRTGRNTGNLAFTFASKLILGRNVNTFDWGSLYSSDDIDNESLVISCANQLGSHCDMGAQAEKISDIDMPVVALGLGAQANNLNEMPDIPEGTLKWLNEICKKSISSQPNIGLRGHHSYNFLKELGLEKHAMVLGCPSNFINPDPNLGKKIQAKTSFPPKRIAVPAGSPWVKAHQTVERTLADLVTITGGSYITQMTLEMLKLSRNDFSSLTEKELLNYRNFIRPGLTIPEFITWCRRHMIMFTNVPAWMEYLRGFDFVVGNRIHGIMLAIQAGIPAMCIAHDSRIVELCEVMHIPYVSMDKIKHNGLTAYNLQSFYQFDGEKYDENRKKLAMNFKNFFENNKIKTTNHLMGVLK